MKNSSNFCFTGTLNHLFCLKNAHKTKEHYLFYDIKQRNRRSLNQQMVRILIL